MALPGEVAVKRGPYEGAGGGLSMIRVHAFLLLVVCLSLYLGTRSPSCSARAELR